MITGDDRMSPWFGGIFAVLTACSGSTGPSTTPWITPPSGLTGAASGTEVERFFPLVDGHIYQYATTNELNDQGILVARVFRRDVAHGELRYPSGKVKAFEFGPEGVRLAPSGVFVLKTPLETATAWRGENGGQTRIFATNVSIDVKAGHFDQCIQTLEERRGDQPIRLATTFCPNVGVVLLEAGSGANIERAELKSYGAATEFGPDGVNVLK